MNYKTIIILLFVTMIATSWLAVILSRPEPMKDISAKVTTGLLNIERNASILIENEIKDLDHMKENDFEVFK